MLVHSNPPEQLRAVSDSWRTNLPDALHLNTAFTVADEGTPEDLLEGHSSLSEAVLMSDKDFREQNGLNPSHPILHELTVTVLSRASYDHPSLRRLHIDPETIRRSRGHVDATSSDSMTTKTQPRSIYSTSAGQPTEWYQGRFWIPRPCSVDVDTSENHEFSLLDPRDLWNMAYRAATGLALAPQLARRKPWTGEDDVLLRSTPLDVHRMPAIDLKKVNAGIRWFFRDVVSTDMVRAEQSAQA